MKVNFDIKLTEGQKDAWTKFHDKGTKTLVCVWSRQSGKSVFAELLCLEYLLSKGKFSAYITPTYALSRKVYKEIVHLLQPTGFLASSNSSTLTITTTMGSTLQFFSVEGYAAIRGNTVSGILILDEASYFQEILPNGEHIFSNVIYPITKARKPKTVLISTPRGKQGFFYDFYLKGLENKDGIVSIKRTIYDDSLITKEDVEEIKRTIPQLAFKQEFECEFLDDGTSFFQGFSECFDIDKASKTQRSWCGIDLSSNGEDRTVLTLVNEKNEVSQFVVEGPLDAKYAKIAGLLNTLNPQDTYIEINGVGSPMFNEIRKLTIRKSSLHQWTTTNNSKEEIISDLAVEIAKHNVHFERENALLKEELGNFSVSLTKTKKLSFQGRNNQHDDTVMSLAIALKAKKDFTKTTQIGFLRQRNLGIY